MWLTGNLQKSRVVINSQRKLSMYVCIYMCVYYAYLYIYGWMCVYIYRGVCIYKYAYTHTPIYVYTHPHIHMYIGMHGTNMSDYQPIKRSATLLGVARDIFWRCFWVEGAFCFAIHICEMSGFL